MASVHAVLCWALNCDSDSADEIERYFRALGQEVHDLGGVLPDQNMPNMN